MIDIDKIYKDKFGVNSDVKALGWGSESSQKKRFDVLLEINTYSFGDSVLDVGCGFGDLSKYVDSSKYTGIDIRKTAIKQASEKYKDLDFISCDIENILSNYDWVIGSGIFCFNTNDWTEYTSDKLLKMLNLSNKGVSVNFLSDLTTGNRDKDMKYTTINEISNIVSKITNKFTIRHDYMVNDLTVYLYKQ